MAYLKIITSRITIKINLGSDSMRPITIITQNKVRLKDCIGVKSKNNLIMVKQKGMDHYRVAALYENKKLVNSVIKDIFIRANGDEDEVIYSIPRE